MSDILVIGSTTVDVLEVDGDDFLVVPQPSPVTLLTSTTQGPVGPPGTPGSVSYLTQTNDEATSLVIGCPVYNDANDGAKRAKGNALATSKVVGLVHDSSIGAGSQGSFQVAGVLAATTGQWDAVTGGSGGLVFNSLYFLHQSTAGMLTTAPLTTPGLFIVPMGLAISTTEMLLRVGQPVLQ